MKKLDQKGFTALELILIVIVIGLLGAAGIYYFKHQKKSDEKPTSTNTTSATPTKENTVPTPDPTADWATYASSDNKVSFKYPKTWVMASHPEFCSPGIVLIGANPASVGACASENFGQMAVTWQPEHGPCGLSSSYTIISTEQVTLSGIKGQKTIGTVNASTDGVGLPSGTKVIQYCFIKTGTTYVASYTQKTEYPDVQNDFNTMMTKTFKLN